MPDGVFVYCGPAAVPDDVWMRWNLDPLLMLALAGFAGLLVCSRSGNRRFGWIALAITAMLFVSPLCALSSALFSARAVHHVLLITAVAPLIAITFPLGRVRALPLPVVIAVQAATLWVWHTPGAYTWGLTSGAGYWLMQLSLVGSAWALWRGILVSKDENGAVLLALVATIAQMGLLGALIVFAPKPLYAVHFSTTGAWHLSPLADQQLAGLLMWVPANLPFLAVALWLLWSSLRPLEQTV